MYPLEQRPVGQRLPLEVLERIAFHLGSPFDQAFQRPSPSVIYSYLRMGSLVCRDWRPAFQRRLVSEVVLAGWRPARPSPWPMARKLLASGLGKRYPVDRMHLGMNPLDDDFDTDATEIFAGLDPVDWVSDRDKDSKLPKPVLPLLEKLEISSSDLPGVMDLPLNVEMPRLHNLQLYVNRRASQNPTILAKWVEVLFGGARSALSGRPASTSAALYETVKLNISHLERLEDCIRAVGSNGAPCHSLKIERGESDCEPEDLSRLWAILTSSLKTDPWDYLEILHIDLTYKCLELAIEIPHLSTLLEAAKQSRAVELPKGQYLPDTTPEEMALEQPLRQWTRDRMAEAGLKDACKDKEIGLGVVYRYM
ncbi:BQ5605_C009g05739 [Microbotryum silenes-dioicae]|uniref:BQ5605_C009g05739 protein n=1 Tax=Microbotryum silenes-dioicae TaxID=796604 RepID=A0A2X0PG00_9BASI|nr:BQ5605_C009g05739 [Microbotryum silenes-dioicae]